MSADLYLFCKQTKEAVLAIKSNGGMTTPASGTSSKALYAFLAYHQRLGLRDVDFCLTDLEGGHYDEYEFPSDLENMKDTKEQLEAMGEKPKFILRWDAFNFESFLSRDKELFDKFDPYDFGHISAFKK